MTAIVLACETIAMEVRMAIRKTGSEYPVVWVESGLHNYPHKLKNHLQEELNRLENVDYILMLFGLCGNALLELSSPHSSLVIPRVDDCISMLLGGNSRREALVSESKAYYLTAGWLQQEINIWNEYKNSREKYGVEITRQIFSSMLKHYQTLLVIDTGAYQVGDLLPIAKQIASELGLSLDTVPGSSHLLCQALRGEWDNNFAIIEPGHPVTIENLRYFKQFE